MEDDATGEKVAGENIITGFKRADGLDDSLWRIVEVVKTEQDGGDRDEIGSILGPAQARWQQAAEQPQPLPDPVILGYQRALIAVQHTSGAR